MLRIISLYSFFIGLPWLYQFLCFEIFKNPVGLRMWALITLIYVAILIEVILLSGGVPTTRASRSDHYSTDKLFKKKYLKFDQ